MFRARRAKQDQLEGAALIAEAIRRRVGVTLGDNHIALALMMFDQINRRRPRRATEGIRVVNRMLTTRRDRSLTAALPTLYYGGIRRLPVTVLVTSGDYAREDAELYRTISEELDSSIAIEALEDVDQARATFSNGRATITVATSQTLDAAKPQNSMLIVRLDTEGTNQLAATVPQVATLPDL